MRALLMTLLTVSIFVVVSGPPSSAESGAVERAVMCVGVPPALNVSHYDGTEHFSNTGDVVLALWRKFPGGEWEVTATIDPGKTIGWEGTRGTELSVTTQYGVPGGMVCHWTS